MKRLALALVVMFVLMVPISAQGPQTSGMLPHLDNCYIFPSGGRRYIACTGWAIHDFRIRRDTPRIGFFIGQNVAPGAWAPVVGGQRQDICPAYTAAWGWMCKPGRSHELETNEWFGHAPENQSYVGITTFSIDITTATGPAQLAMWENVPPGVPAMVEWSNPCPFNVKTNGAIVCP
jgi:hypothetical protein